LRALFFLGRPWCMAFKRRCDLFRERAMSLSRLEQRSRYCLPLSLDDPERFINPVEAITDETGTGPPLT
jgi:hypothetical protein